MFNLQESLDAHKKALQEICRDARKSGVSLEQNRKNRVKSAIVTVTKDSIKKSLVDSGIITVKGEFTNLNRRIL
jgi:hypothetical protein